MSKLEVSARMTVRAGKLEGFKQQAAECIRQAKEKTQDAPLRLVSHSDQTACEVREVYETSEGLIEHQMHIGGALHKLFADFATDHAVTIYGDPSPQLVAAAKGMKDVSIKCIRSSGGSRPE